MQPHHRERRFALVRSSQKTTGRPRIAMLNSRAWRDSGDYLCRPSFHGMEVDELVMGPWRDNTERAGGRGRGPGGIVSAIRESPTRYSPAAVHIESDLRQIQ